MVEKTPDIKKEDKDSEKSSKKPNKLQPNKKKIRKK